MGTGAQRVRPSSTALRSVGRVIRSKAARPPAATTGGRLKYYATARTPVCIVFIVWFPSLKQK